MEDIIAGDRVGLLLVRQGVDREDTEWTRFHRCRWLLNGGMTDTILQRITVEPGKVITAPLAGCVSACDILDARFRRDP